MSTHEDNKQSEIEVSTHRVEESTHMDSKQTRTKVLTDEIEVSTYEDSVKRIEGVDT